MTALVFGQTLCRHSPCRNPPAAEGYCARHAVACVAPGCLARVGLSNRYAACGAHYDAAITAARRAAMPLCAVEGCGARLRSTNRCGYCQPHRDMSDARAAERLTWGASKRGKASRRRTGKTRNAKKTAARRAAMRICAEPECKARLPGQNKAGRCRDHGQAAYRARAKARETSSGSQTAGLVARDPCDGATHDDSAARSARFARLDGGGHCRGGSGSVSMNPDRIRIYSDLPTHRKSLALAALLGSPRAWSHVVELWLWCSRVLPGGDLRGVSDATIARRSGWTGDAGRFVAALREAGFVSERGRLRGCGEAVGESGYWPRDAVPAVYERDGRACRYCGTTAGRLSVDHVQPQSRGGGHELENLVVACIPCNSRKNDRTPEEAGMLLFPPPRVTQ